MDRPLGPRPDKRNVAYESIFGRPSVHHHRPSPAPAPSTLQYTQSLRQPNYNAQAAYPTQQQYDRRISQLSQVSQPPLQYAPQRAPSVADRQSYYPQAQQQYYPNSAYAPVDRASLAPPESYYARSNRSIPGVVAPRHDDQLDPGLEDMVRQGMTPAQAYQAQVYSKSPNGQHLPPSYRNPSPIHLPAHEAPPALPDPPPSQDHDDPNVPRLNIPLVDGHLDIDFAGIDDPTPRGDEVGKQDLSASIESGVSDLSSDFQALAGPSTRPYPLQLDTALASGFSDPQSPASSTFVDHSPTAPSPRRSSESSRTMPPRPVSVRRERTVQDRSRSMSATALQSRAILTELKTNPRPSMPSLLQGQQVGDRNSISSTVTPKRAPVAYPALLSRVAEVFQARMTVAERAKDGLLYVDAFDGREAVDKLAYIIKTGDRNLALLLGRALDAQKFFHDVTYDHRLRDSPNELYQFRTKLRSPFHSGELGNEATHAEASTIGHGDGVSTNDHDEGTLVEGDVSDAPTTGKQRPRSSSTASDDMPLPSGVFTLLTNCYSPTCTRDRLCYSIACPRRLEQQARLHMKPQPGLKRSVSTKSLGDFVEPGTLWIHSVPPEVANSISDTEKKRQEAINEVIYTERDFVRDMEYLRDVWIARLKNSDIIAPSRRLDFLEQVFWNIHDIIAVNTRLRDALNKRQKNFQIVERLGDIFLDAVPHFNPFVSYGSHQLYGKYEFEKEKSSNPAFQRFVDETERLPESRKLELNGYLTKPTTRLARYPLLLGTVLKYTPDDNADKADLVNVIAMIREFLSKVNVESGKTENRFNLLQLDQQLTFRPGEEVNLRLHEEGRELVYKGSLKRRGGQQGDSGDLQVFLFDHALLMVKQKSKHEQFKVYRRPIPLELLLLFVPDEAGNLRSGGKNAQKTLTKRNSFSKTSPHQSTLVPVKTNPKDGFSITFVHLGRKYYQLTLWASTHINRKKWVETIQKQQEVMRERSLIFDLVTLSEGFFVNQNRVNCAAPFDGGRRVAYGTNDGVYISNLRDQNRHPSKVLALLDVTQVDILEEFQLLIVLSEHQVLTFPLDSLSEHDPMAGLRRAKRISSHTSFFKAGTCLGRTLVCVVKASQLSSTIKALEPIDYAIRAKNKPTFKKLLQGGHDTLRPFREFYIPVQSSSIHYLKTRLCVGCVKGFEIVDLETLDTQALLDPSDTSLEFVQKREDVRPMAIYRIENDFLLCYDEFAFYVNKNGWRTRNWFMVHWEGYPRAFALHYPYVLAFEPTFVEVRHVETGSLSQIIQGNNLRCLFADTPLSTTASAATAYQQAAYQQQYRPGQALDSQPYAPYGGRQSMSSSYNGHPGQAGYGPLPPQRRTPSHGRDQIILVSDDRVMALQMIAPANPMSDSWSMVSH